MARINHTQYGISKTPANIDCLKNNTVIISTIINKERHIINAFFICLYKKNTHPQLKFNNNCNKKRNIAISLLKEFGEKSSKINATAIKKYNTFHAPRKTALDGVNLGLFRLS